MKDCKIISAKRIGDAAPVYKLATPVLGITSKTATSILVNWSNVPNATTYILQWSLFADFSVILGTNANATGFQQNIAGLTALTTYYFRVKCTAAGYTDSDYGYINSTTNSGVVMDNLYISVYADQHGMNEAEILAGQAVPYAVGATILEMDLRELSGEPVIYRVAVRKNVPEMIRWEEDVRTGNVGRIALTDVWYFRGEVASLTGPDWRLYYTTDPFGTLFEPSQNTMKFFAS